jgi:hypothetical protein
MIDGGSAEQSLGRDARRSGGHFAGAINRDRAGIPLRTHRYRQASDAFAPGRKMLVGSPTR